MQICFLSADSSAKIVYNRPAGLQTDYEPEVSGPWLDPSFSVHQLTGSVTESNQLLKSPIVSIWPKLPIAQVCHLTLPLALMTSFSIDRTLQVCILQHLVSLYVDVLATILLLISVYFCTAHLKVK